MQLIDPSGLYGVGMQESYQNALWTPERIAKVRAEDQEEQTRLRNMAEWDRLALQNDSTRQGISDLYNPQTKTIPGAPRMDPATFERPKAQQQAQQQAQYQQQMQERQSMPQTVQQQTAPGRPAAPDRTVTLPYENRGDYGRILAEQQHAKMIMDAYGPTASAAVTAGNNELRQSIAKSIRNTGNPSLIPFAEVLESAEFTKDGKYLTTAGDMLKMAETNPSMFKTFNTNVEALKALDENLPMVYQGTLGKAMQFEKFAEPKQEKNVQILPEEDLPISDGDSMREWVKASKKDFANPGVYRDAMKVAESYDAKSAKEKRLYRDSLAIRKGIDGQIYTVGTKTKAAPAAQFKVEIGTGGSKEFDPDRQIRQVALDKTGTKDLQANKDAVYKKLIDYYDGDRTLAAEGLNVMERNASRGQREKIATDAAIAAKESVNNVLIPAIEEWGKERNFSSEREKVAALVNKDTQGLLAKSKNEIENFFATQGLSTAGTKYAVAAFDAIRQVNTAVSGGRGGAQKSLDLEHKFFSPSNSISQLKGVAEMELEAVKQSEKAYGFHPLPKTKAERERDAAEASAKKGSEKFSDPNSSNPRRKEAVNVVADLAKYAGATDSKKQEMMKFYKAKKWTDAELQKLTREAGWH